MSRVWRQTSDCVSSLTCSFLCHWLSVSQNALSKYSHNYRKWLDLYIENYSHMTIKAFGVFVIYRMWVPPSTSWPVTAAMHSGLFVLMWSLKLILVILLLCWMCVCVCLFVCVIGTFTRVASIPIPVSDIVSDTAKNAGISIGECASLSTAPIPRDLLAAKRCPATSQLA